MDCNAAGEQVAAELGERALWPGTVDVTSEADVLRAIQQTKERFGAIHGALNIAGVLEYNRVTRI